MTITAIGDVGFVPPRVEVEVSVPASNVMTSVSVWRNDSGGRSLVRSQPSAGFESRIVYDYECPYGQNVTYDWAATYYDPADNSTTFSEPWTTFPGSWTGDTGSASIGSNRVTLLGDTSVGRSIVRSALNADFDTITIAYLSAENVTNQGLRFDLDSGNFILSSAGGFVRVQRSTGEPIGYTTAIDATQPFTLTRDGSVYTISGDGGATTPAFTASGDLQTITLQAPAAAVAINTVVGAISVETFAAVFDLAETSSPVNLNPADAWLVAPQAPALSVPLSNSNQQAAGIRTIGPVSNASNTTIHRILGTATPITTTTGNRQDDTLSATVYTHTSEERQNLKALLAPDTPILINVPPAWDIDLDYGFYQVGDVTETRPYTLGGIPMRDFQLPLTKVRSPDVDVENPGWSYAQLATTWATYTELLTNYATYADLTADNRS